MQSGRVTIHKVLVQNPNKPLTFQHQWHRDLTLHWSSAISGLVVFHWSRSFVRNTTDTKNMYWSVNTRVQLFQNIHRNTHKVEIFWSGIFLHKKPSLAGTSWSIFRTCQPVDRNPSNISETPPNSKDTSDFWLNSDEYTHEIGCNSSFEVYAPFKKCWLVILSFLVGFLHFQGPCQTSREQSFLSIIMDHFCCTTAQRDF